MFFDVCFRVKHRAAAAAYEDDTNEANLLPSARRMFVPKSLVDEELARSNGTATSGAEEVS